MYPAVHAAATPDKPAYLMATSGETVTYAELEADSNRIAHLLRNAGIRQGDAIAICAENHPWYFKVCWAAQRAGLQYTAISSRLTVGEAEYIVNDCGAKAYVTSTYKAELAADLRERMPNVVLRVSMDGPIDGYETLSELIADLPTTPIADEAEGADMLYSSGTTGRPKGVKTKLPLTPMGTPSALSGLLQALYGATAGSVYLSPAPFYHAAPLRYCLNMMRFGATVIAMEHFDPEEALALIERYRVTHAQWVPTMFVRMLKLDPEVRNRYDVGSLQVAVHAAAPCPIPVKEQMIAWWGPKIFEYYAGTEGNGFCAITSEEWLSHKGSVGRNLVGAVHICDDDGSELPTGEAGVIFFEGGIGTFEYHNDPEKTKSSRHPEHDTWSTLGDIGYVDADGYVYLTDCKANMIISGGVNIYPQEAENVLTMHPRVGDVAVFGVPNEEFGEEVKAVVQPVSWGDVDSPEKAEALERELIEFCRQQLAGLKCPRTIDFEAQLPRHPTGKLYKRLLKDRYWEGRTLTS
jgi:acyl-CoA synthetase (AMP-forming)/AMP-acid ligase II